MTTRRLLSIVCASVAAGCRGRDATRNVDTSPPPSTIVVHDTTIPAVLAAAGVAEPVRVATLSTKLMGTVTDVVVREGQIVGQGDLLARVDAREVATQRAQAGAALDAALATTADAERQARRLRALYADSAAPKAQLEGAETVLARAEAQVRTARAAVAGADVMASYAEIRAPFAGLVTHRFVDPGAFVAPGAPVVAVDDASRLRIVVTTAPSAVRGLSRGATLDATIEGAPASAVVEGVVRTSAGTLYTVNALVDNHRGAFLAGGAATVWLPQGTRTGILVPERALVREGDLTGVYVLLRSGPVLRWVQIGRVEHGAVEVLAGLKSGDRVVVPPSVVGER